MNMLEIAKIISTIFIYLTVGYILVAKVTGTHWVVGMLIKLMALITGLYVSLLLLGIITI
jgi:hypothetical protein